MLQAKDVPELMGRHLEEVCTCREGGRARERKGTREEGGERGRGQGRNGAKEEGDREEGDEGGRG